MGHDRYREAMPEGLRLLGRAAVVDDVLMVADLHLGRSAGSNVELPLGTGAEMIDRLTDLVDAVDPAEVVLAGDLLHSFGTVPLSVDSTVSDLRAAIRDRGARPVVTPGNHDGMLDSVWDGPTPTEYRVGDTVVAHGHRDPETSADRYVIGHDHPAIEVEGQKRHCFLYGEGVYRGADVLMLPAFTRTTGGVAVNGMSAGEFQSPLVTDIDAFRPAVRDREETLWFPPLGELRRHLRY